MVPATPLSQSTFPWLLGGSHSTPMRDVKEEDLGACQNPSCGVGCGQFFPDYDPGAPSRPLAITFCAVCKMSGSNCVGSQHLVR